MRAAPNAIRECVGVRGRGEPVVSNGLALCNLHHAAYDRNILGVTPDLKVEVRRADLYVPRRQDLKPNPEFLADRYAIFQQAY